MEYFFLHRHLFIYVWRLVFRQNIRQIVRFRYHWLHTVTFHSFWQRLDFVLPIQFLCFFCRPLSSFRGQQCHWIYCIMRFLLVNCSDNHNIWRCYPCGGIHPHRQWLHHGNINGRLCCSQITSKRMFKFKYCVIRLNNVSSFRRHIQHCNR